MSQFATKISQGHPYFGGAFLDALRASPRRPLLKMRNLEAPSLGLLVSVFETELLVSVFKTQLLVGVFKTRRREKLRLRRTDSDALHARAPSTLIAAVSHLSSHVTLMTTVLT